MGAREQGSLTFHGRLAGLRFRVGGYADSVVSETYVIVGAALAGAKAAERPSGRRASTGAWC